MRLIDADTVVTIQVYDDMTEETNTKKITVAEAIDEWSDEGCPPTVDAVEVVRCKDCKFFRRYGFRLEYAECINFDFYDTTEDGYCSWGERREDGKI